MEINRDYYLQKLIDRKHNGQIKVITGVCRCGKTAFPAVTRSMKKGSESHRRNKGTTLFCST